MDLEIAGDRMEELLGRGLPAMQNHDQ